LADGVCKLTGKTGKLVKSHLYPRSFYGFLPDEVTKVIPSGGTERARRYPIGFYDNELLSLAAEQQFAEYDDHAAKVLKAKVSVDQLFKEKDDIPIGEDGLPYAYFIRDFDFDRLQLFFMSVIWRFGASTRREADAVRLGPYLERLRELLEANNPGDPSWFSVVGSRFIEDNEVPLATPVKMRLGDTNVWNLLFGGYEFYIRIDKRPLPDPYPLMELNRRRDFPILIRRFADSPARRSIAKTVRRYVERFGDPYTKQSSG
jgi:hypothetical protein